MSCCQYLFPSGCRYSICGFFQHPDFKQDLIRTQNHGSPHVNKPEVLLWIINYQAAIGFSVKISILLIKSHSCVHSCTNIKIDLCRFQSQACNIDTSAAERGAIVFLLCSITRLSCCCFLRRTMPCRPCRCWKGCTWKVSAAWEAQDSLSSAPVKRRRKPSKYAFVYVCCLFTSRKSSGCISPPLAVAMETTAWMQHCDAHWRSCFFFSLFIHAAPPSLYSETNTSEGDMVQVESTCHPNPCSLIPILS